MRVISAALAALALALVAPAHAVDQPSTYPGCAERQADVPWGGAVTIDLSACQSFGLGVLATPPAHGQASPAPDAPAEQVVYVHGGSGPAGGGKDHFVVLDDNSDRISVHVRIAAPTLGVAISPGTLTGLRAGMALSVPLGASGGQAPYVFQLAGGSLPDGLSLSADGRLQGAPTRRGPYAFTVAARDARGAEGRHAYAGDVAAARFALAPATAAVVRGQAFELKLSAAGGVPPHRFSLEPGATLPPGVSLSGDGWLRGVAATPPGDYRAAVRVTDTSTGPGESFEVEPLLLRLVAPPAISLDVVPEGENGAALVVDRGQVLAVSTQVVIDARGEGLAGRESAGLPRTALILPGERRARVPLPPDVVPAGGPGLPFVLAVTPGPGYQAGAQVEARLRPAR